VAKGYDTDAPEADEHERDLAELASELAQRSRFCCCKDIRHVVVRIRVVAYRAVNNSVW
jgi:hypothetical protein